MVSYITDFVCTYQLIDDSDDSDKLFKLQFLQAFNYDLTNSTQSLEEYFNTISITTSKLYDLYKANELIKKLIDKIKTSNSNYNNENNENNETNDFIIFQLCFSYSYFYIIHKILCSLINSTSTINNYQEILKIINTIE